MIDGCSTVSLLCDNLVSQRVIFSRRHIGRFAVAVCFLLVPLFMICLVNASFLTLMRAHGVEMKVLYPTSRIVDVVGVVKVSMDAFPRTTTHPMVTVNIAMKNVAKVFYTIV